ncbi:MAG: hypothetical protein M0021_03435 [Clostridia bacterium]|nr:hypothetical protein [Clostridia bacterium]
MPEQKNNTDSTKTTGGKTQGKAKPNKLTYSETFVETAPLGTWKEGRTK